MLLVEVPHGRPCSLRLGLAGVAKAETCDPRRLPAESGQEQACCHAGSLSTSPRAQGVSRKGAPMSAQLPEPEPGVVPDRSPAVRPPTPRRSMPLPSLRRSTLPHLRLNGSQRLFRPFPCSNGRAGPSPIRRRPTAHVMSPAPVTCRVERYETWGNAPARLRHLPARGE